MTDAIIAIASGSVGAAVAAGVMSIILYRIKRRDSRRDAADVRSAAQTTALRYIMLFIIRWQGTEFVRHGSITWEDRKMLHKWHELYHNELGGNGDAELLMSLIDKLPLEMKGDADD